MPRCLMESAKVYFAANDRVVYDKIESLLYLFGLVYERMVIDQYGLRCVHVFKLSASLILVSGNILDEIPSMWPRTTKFDLW
jgi:hypothetical protein